MIRPAWRSGGILIRLRHVGVGVHAGVLYSVRNQLSLAGPVSIIVSLFFIRHIENLSFILIRIQYALLFPNPPVSRDLLKNSTP